MSLLDISQMAGPVAQLIFAKQSLGSHLTVVEDGILIHFDALLDQEGLILLELHWGGDLQNSTQILTRAKMAAQLGNSCPGVGGYLFEAEQSLRTFFTNELVKELFWTEVHELAEKRQRDANTFIASVRSVIPPSAVDALLQCVR
jgi:hypothetical protein